MLFRNNFRSFLNCTFILDENGHSAALKRVEKLTKRKLTEFYKVDCRDKAMLETIFKKVHTINLNKSIYLFQHKIDCVMHFAALKAVGESMTRALDYYHNNLISSLSLLQVETIK
jgi:UDP-glucose 4-epimerase